jgi:proteasome lid subunit RPN8/RPN11
MHQTGRAIWRQVLMAVLLCSIAMPAKAQLHVRLVAPDSATAAILRDGFRYGNGAERLWCVTRWDSVSHETYDQITVRSIREDTEAAKERGEVKVVSTTCRDAQGRALPTIHSHPGGTCQASPGDVEIIMLRNASFDGILCAETSHVWYFADQFFAIWRSRFAPTEP